MAPTSKKKKNDTRRMTPTATLSYPKWTPETMSDDPNADKAYSAVFVFTKEQQATPEFLALIEAASLAADDFFASEGGRQVFAAGVLDLIGGKGAVFRNDDRRKQYPDGALRIHARLKAKYGSPQAVFRYPGTDGKPKLMTPAEMESELYAGAQVRATVSAYGYDVKGNRGVTWGLGNIQKMADGPRLDSRKQAVDEFEADLSATPASLDDVE